MTSYFWALFTRCFWEIRFGAPLSALWRPEAKLPRDPTTWYAISLSNSQIELSWCQARTPNSWSRNALVNPPWFDFRQPMSIDHCQIPVQSFFEEFLPSNIDFQLSNPKPFGFTVEDLRLNANVSFVQRLVSYSLYNLSVILKISA